MKLTLVTNDIYNKLKDPEGYLFNYGYEDFNEASNPEYQKAKIALERAAFTFQGDYTPLPPPFEGVASIFSKQGDFYSGLLNFWINPKFLKHSKKVKKNLEDHYKDKWAPLDLLGRGHISNGNNEVSMIITGAKNLYTLAIGSYGAKPLLIDPEQKCLGDIGALERSANIFMDAWFDSVPLSDFPQKDLEVYLRI